LVATLSHLMITVGLLLMVVGLLSSTKTALFVATLLLGSGFTLLLIAIFLAIKKVTFLNATIRAMRWALLFAGVTVLLGMHLLSSHAIGISSSLHLVFANIHAVVGILGFAGVLVMGVSFQVIPMFYVTPAFNERYQKYLVLTVVVSLVLWSLLGFFMDTYAWVAKLLLSMIFFGYGALILQKMNQRKRPIADITVYYWRLTGAMALVGFLFWLVLGFIDADLITFVALIVGGGFLMSVITGMLYKIIPFLVWFHLNGMGYMGIPSMGEMINKKMALVQFVLFVVSLALFLLSFWIPVLSKVGAVILFVSMVLLEINLVRAYRNYGETRKRKPDFDMSMMGKA